VVIGAGIVGAAVAAGLTRRGAHVTVLEERFPGAGSSATSFAWVHADETDPEPYFTLSHAAVHAHHALGSAAFHPTGRLTWASGIRRGELTARVEELRGREYAVERVTAGRAAELEPYLAPGLDDTDHVLFPEEGYVLPVPLLGRFLDEARVGGARIETGARVREIKTGGGGVSVALADGGVRAADFVVGCAGHWTSPLLEGVAPVVLAPETPDAGFVLSTTPVAARLSRVLTTDRLQVRPDGGGRLLLRALELDGPADPEVPPRADVGAALMGRLPELLTGTEGARVERVRVARRARSLLRAGFVDADRRVYTVMARSAATLAPLLADLVAAEIHGTESALLGPFRPVRVSGA
jgi:glycine/D-amino acid oxidase-like deaminating enzyme